MRKLTIPIALTVAVLILGGRVPSLAGGDGFGASLQVPMGYVVISPLSRVLDGLTLLSTPQSIALFITIGIIALLMSLRSKDKRLKRAAIALAVTIGALATLEGMAVLLPRPMAALHVGNPNAIRIDFHSHTGASHDVRKSFTAEDNREWHRAGGFDLAYVTDHVTFAGAEAASAKNPPLAGEGVSLVAGMEGRYHKIMSTIVLGITRADSAKLNRRGNILPGEWKDPRHPPLTIIAIPNRNLDSISAKLRDSTVALPNLVAIELVDAAPRGLGQLDRDEARLRKIASDLNICVVAASNNHGWGRTVAAWNVMVLSNWRAYSPDLARRMVEALLCREGGRVTIIQRTRPSLHGASVAAILPVLSYQILGGLTLPERISWIAWIWALTLLTLFLSRRRLSLNHRKRD